MVSNEFPLFPRPAVAVLVERKGKLLVVLRGNPPAKDTWSLPGGSIELGETVLEAAEREVGEETGVQVKAEDMVTYVDAIYRQGEAVRFHYVIIYVAARYVGGEVSPGDDAKDAGFYSIEELNTMPVEKKTLEIINRLWMERRGRGG